ncbi:hypothetical protein BDB13_5690 [Rhodococcus sp. OK302]|nr:hypothetical protein BDB13_5690 [Rhodococcus sp. OK302]
MEDLPTGRVVDLGDIEPLAQWIERPVAGAIDNDASRFVTTGTESSFVSTGRWPAAGVVRRQASGLGESSTTSRPGNQRPGNHIAYAATSVLAHLKLRHRHPVLVDHGVLVETIHFTAPRAVP